MTMTMTMTTPISTNTSTMPTTKTSEVAASARKRRRDYIANKQQQQQQQQQDLNHHKKKKVKVMTSNPPVAPAKTNASAAMTTTATVIPPSPPCSVTGDYPVAIPNKTHKKKAPPHVPATAAISAQAATTKRSNHKNIRYDPPSLIIKDSSSSDKNGQTKTRNMTKEEISEWRRDQRKQRNRASAAASRQKVKSRIAELEKEVEGWKEKYFELKGLLEGKQQKQLEQGDVSGVSPSPSPSSSMEQQKKPTDEAEVTNSRPQEESSCPITATTTPGAGMEACTNAAASPMLSTTNSASNEISRPA